MSGAKTAVPKDGPTARLAGPALAVELGNGFEGQRCQCDAPWLLSGEETDMPVVFLPFAEMTFLDCYWPTDL